MSYELYTTKHWMILPSFVHGILPTLMYNSNNHIALGVLAKKQPYLVACSDEVIRDSQVTEDGAVVPRYDWDGMSLLAQMKEPFVNVIPIDGPITRNGDACSYGSKDIRDWMMEAADNQYCRAHVLDVNTPGGSAWAKNDFQQAIDYAHERGQRIYMLVDGMCASVGMYFASFCDEVYVVNLKDQLGCVGVMASFFTLKSGDKNQFNSETYHEYYATKSINKNKEYRDIAEDDDATLLIAELDKLEDEFRTDMQAAFPDATDEHLDGKIFYADEVMGVFCDGQMLLGNLVDRAFAVANGEEEPIARTANRIIISPQNSTTMPTNEKYQKLAQLLEVDELVVTEEGTFLNIDLLNKLNEKVDEMESKAAEAEAAKAATQEGKTSGTATEEPAAEEAPAKEEPATEEPATEEKPSGESSGTETEAPATEQPSAEEVASAEAEIDRISETLRDAEAKYEAEHAAHELLQGEHAKLQEDYQAKDDAFAKLADEHNKQSADLTAAQALVAERDKTIEEKDALITERDNTIAELQATIEAQKQQIADKEAEIAELAEKPTHMVDAGAGIPADNGTGEAPKYNGVKSEINAGMSVEEIRAKLREKDEKQKTYRH